MALCFVQEGRVCSFLYLFFGKLLFSSFLIVSLSMPAEFELYILQFSVPVPIVSLPLYADLYSTLLLVAFLFLSACSVRLYYTSK